MTSNGADQRPGRETRLLILVVVVSLAALLLLARFRFPAADLTTVTPGATPLAGLAARANFDEMSAAMTSLLTRVAPALVMLQLDAELPVAPPSAGPGRAAAAPRADDGPVVAGLPPLVLPGLRIRADLAVVHVPEGYHVTAGSGLSEPVEVLRIDREHAIAVVRLPTSAGLAVALPTPMLSVSGFGYFGVVQATPHGPTVSPVFVGRVDPADDARWARPLIAVAPGPEMPPGALVFTIDGRLVGLVIRHLRGMAIVPAAALNDAVSAAQGTPNP